MRRWWRWTWRAWIAILLTTCVGFLLFVIVGRMGLTLSPIAFSYSRSALPFVVELCWALVTARFLLTALRADFSAISSRRWTTIFAGGTCITFVVGAIADSVVEFASDSASLYYSLVVHLIRGLVLAAALWWFVLRSHFQGGTAWLAWNTAAIFIVWARLPVTDMFGLADPKEAALLSIVALFASMVLAAPISGVGAARLSPRHGT